MAGSKGYSIVVFYFKMVLTFGVNHKDFVVGENDAARVYAIPDKYYYSET